MDFSRIIDFFNQNSLILWIIGIIIALILFIKGKRIKSIKFCIKNDPLIKDFDRQIEKLNIEYSGKQIKTFTITKIAFWNNGTETLNRSDIPINDKFTISIDNDFDILDASIIQESNKSNAITINFLDDKKMLLIDFEYIDKNEGFVLQLFHNDIKSDHISINGTIKGFGKISKGLIKRDTLQIFIKELFSPLFISIMTFSTIHLYLYINVFLLILPFILFTSLLAYIKYKILYPTPKLLLDNFNK